MSEEGKVQYGQYTVPPAKENVNYCVGQPSPVLLPLTMIQEGMNYVSTKITDPSLLQYGDIPGYFSFRNDLAGFLTNSYNDPTSHAELFVTNGISQALALLCSVFMKAGDIVYVEEPTYFLARNIFLEYGLEVISVPMDENGIIIEEFEKLLNESDPTKEKILYIIPDSHNPTGYDLSHERRQQLGAIADKTDNLMIVADEVYKLLKFSTDDDMLKPMCRYTDKAISLGTFSKILAPALRLGWIQTSSMYYMDRLKKCGQLDSSGGLNPVICSIVQPLLKTGKLTHHIEFARSVLGNNCYALSNSLLENLSDYVDFQVPTGGYFLWLKLKDPRMDAVTLLEYAQKHKTKFLPGYKFGASNEYLRLSFSYYSSTGYVMGVPRLKAALDEYLEDLNTRSVLKVSVMGHGGRLGSLIVNHLNMYDEYEYIGGINHVVFVDPRTDVVIDVSKPDGTYNLISFLMKNNTFKPLIIGTTGDLPYEQIKEYSKFAPVTIVSNFSEGVSKVCEMIKLMKETGWEAEMTETHHVHKVDKPSGTAKTMASKYDLPMEIESIREGEVFGKHEIVFKSGSGEKITLCHDAETRDIFAVGCLKYISWIKEQEPGLFDEFTMME